MMMISDDVQASPNLAKKRDDDAFERIRLHLVIDGLLAERYQLQCQNRALAESLASGNGANRDLASSLLTLILIATVGIILFWFHFMATP